MIDLANNIKPIGFFRRALWSDEPVAYLGTYSPRRDHNEWLAMNAGRSWNYRFWQEIRVVCYTNGDEAELFLDGKPVGERKPCDPDTAIIQWDIPYKARELKVVVYKDGKAVASDSIRPDGEAAAVKAAFEKGTLEGKYAVAVIPVSIIDADGRLVYGAENEITCTVIGPGRMFGLENASRDALENFLDHKAACSHGRLVAYIQAVADEGFVEITFTAPGLEPAKVILNIAK